MELERETVVVAGREIVVYENDWSMDRKRSRLESEVPEIQPTSSALDYFQRNFYPALASVSVGEVPTIEEAFHLPPEDLDTWFFAVWRMNEDWFTTPAPTDFKTKTVTFRDGSELTVVEASGRPSFMLRLYQLELDATINPSDDPEIQLFNLAFYPKMAACVIGDCPKAETLRAYPTKEQNKLYEAAKELNPSWFRMLDAAGQEAAREKEEKKKGRLKRQAG